MPALRRGSILVSVLAALAVLTACSTSSEAAPATDDSTLVSVTTAYGDVEIPTDVERVAAVSYDTPWQLMSLGITPIATIDYSQWLDSYTAEQQDFIADAAVIGTFGEINFEALAAAAPQLIIGDAYEVDEATYKRLQTIAPTVIVGGDERGSWQDQTEQTAAATRTTDVWEASKAAYEELRDSTKAEYADVIAENTWINFSFGDEAGQFSVQLPTGSTGNLVVNELGLAYGAGAELEDEGGYGYIALPLEQVPAVFAGVTAALTFAQQDGVIYEGIQEIIDSEIFQTLPLAASGQIYGMRTSVTDYVSAANWIVELTDNVLVPLSE